MTVILAGGGLTIEQLGEVVDVRPVLVGGRVRQRPGQLCFSGGCLMPMKPMKLATSGDSSDLTLPTP